MDETTTYPVKNQEPVVPISRDGDLELSRIEAMQLIQDLDHFVHQAGRDAVAKILVNETIVSASDRWPRKRR